MHNVLIIFYIAFSIGNLFILPELELEPGFYTIELSIDKNIFAGDLFIE